MNRCPYCGKAAMSKLRRLFLGPVFSPTCRACGQEVGVSYRSILLACLPIPVAWLIGILVGRLFHSPTLLCTFLIVGAAASTAVGYRLPLEPRSGPVPVQTARAGLIEPSTAEGAPETARTSTDLISRHVVVLGGLCGAIASLALPALFIVSIVSELDLGPDADYSGIPLCVAPFVLIGAMVGAGCGRIGQRFGRSLSRKANVRRPYLVGSIVGCVLAVVAGLVLGIIPAFMIAFAAA
jgi:hypothetical protein